MASGRRVFDLSVPVPGAKVAVGTVCPTTGLWTVRAYRANHDGRLRRDLDSRSLVVWSPATGAAMLGAPLQNGAGFLLEHHAVGSTDPVAEGRQYGIRHRGQRPWTRKV
jgi:hypothetical protein